MAGNSPLKKKEDMTRTHIIIPTKLFNQVRRSAENTDRSFSKMITSILRGVYDK